MAAVKRFYWIAGVLVVALPALLGFIAFFATRTVPRTVTCRSPRLPRVRLLN
ncbi:MAG: hypothetical protein Q8R13_03545 [bacterium]|nr:hypothetical protein [bacterium]